jgi:hypothetical protein
VSIHSRTIPKHLRSFFFMAFFSASSRHIQGGLSDKPPLHDCLKPQIWACNPSRVVLRNNPRAPDDLSTLHPLEHLIDAGEKSGDLCFQQMINSRLRIVLGKKILSCVLIPSVAFFQGMTAIAMFLQRFPRPKDPAAADKPAWRRETCLMS